jgi:hypothetical protein
MLLGETSLVTSAPSPSGFSKRYGRTTMNSCSLQAWCSHFSPVLFAVSSSECAQAYTMGYQLMAALPTRLRPPATLGSCVRQVHGDWAQSVETARKTVFQQSLRAGDFFHLWKNVQSALRQHLTPGADKLVRESHIYTALVRSRTYCTTLTEFHLFWSLLFALMEAPVAHDGWHERKAAEYLRTTYFFKLSLADTAAQYGMSHLPFSDSGVLCAGWWAAYTRLQPGSACGAQPVEAFHGKIFRPAMVNSKGKQVSHLTPPHFFPTLQRAIAALGRQQVKASAPLIDRPTCENVTVRSGLMLNHLGRSTAVQLHARADLLQEYRPARGPALCCHATIPPALDSRRSSSKRRSGPTRFLVANT